MNDSLDRLIEQYAEGLLDDAGFAELESHLQDDPEARERFLEYQHLRGTLDELAMTQSEMSMANARPQPTPTSRWGTGRLVAISSVAAAIALLVGLAIGASFRATTDVADVPRHVDPPPDASDYDRGTNGWVAVLADAKDAVWSDSSSASQGRQRLTARQYELVRGEATLAFRDGALLNLHPGTKLRLIDGGSAQLLAGRVSVQCGNDAVGFSLLTPVGEVIDLGTKFGVSVGPNGATDIHVFEGSVEFTRSQPHGASIKLIEKGAARRVLPNEASVQDVPLNPKVFRTEFHVRASAGTQSPGAQLFVSETFDYAAGKLGFGEGGTGWKSGWNQGLVVRPSQLQVARSNGSSNLELGKYGYGYRQFAQPYVTRTETTVYLSVVVQKVAAGTSEDPNKKQLLLRSTEKQSMPIGFQIWDDVVNVRSQAWRQGDVLGKVNEGDLYRLVGKLTLSEAGEEQFEATMLAEADNDGEPLIWPVSLPLRSKERLKYDCISLHASGTSIYRFDDIRFGNSWEAVTSTKMP